MSRLSLCMIVRDEARFLPGCLESALPAVDELIVVDTGSIDATPRIAKQAGARVLFVDWQEDFAAARNAALDAASGTHVLVLDADERLVPDGHAALRAALARDDLALGLLPLHDADALDAPERDVVSGARRLWQPVRLPRLFRRHPALRFRRRVHETLLYEPQATLDAVGGRILPVEAPIVHYGEVRALRQDLDKSARNRRLLERALTEDPDDGDLAGYLALELVRAGEAEAALALATEHLPRFLARLDRLPSGALKPSPIQLGAVLATLQVERGRAEEALATARSTSARCLAPHPNLRFLEGVALEQLGRLDEAEAAFRDCLAWHGKPQSIPINPGATDAAPALRLANVLLAQGRAEEALGLLDLALERFELATMLAFAEARLALGDATGALLAVAPLLETNAPPPDLFAIAASAAALLGQPEPTFAAAAANADPRTWLEPRRAQLVGSTKTACSS